MKKRDREEPRELPDMDVCRAKDLGISGHAECLIHSPMRCQYALPIGVRYFCKHQEVDEIVRRTREGL